MGFFDKLFDKREKMEYRKACDFIYNIALIQKVQYTENFTDISDDDYRTDIVGIVAAYVDSKPRESYVIGSSMGADIFRYGESMLLAQLDGEFIPKCKKKHTIYSRFVATKMGNALNATTARALAEEVCRINNIAPDPNKLNAIVVDINSLVTVVDGLLTTYRIV